MVVVVVAARSSRSSARVVVVVVVAPFGVVPIGASGGDETGREHDDERGERGGDACRDRIEAGRSISVAYAAPREIRGSGPGRLRRRAGGRARRARRRSKRRGAPAPARARAAQRGRPGDGDPRRAAARERRRKPVDPRLRPARVPHRPGADRGRGHGHRARRPTRSRTGATSSPSGADGTMVDFAAGHLSSEQSHPIVDALDAALGNGRDGVRFHAGVEYRHLVVTPRDWADAECTPPHDLTGKPATFPTGPAAAKLIALMDASRPVVADAAAPVDSIATQIWLWGQGVRPTLPRFAERFGVDGRLTSAVDLVRGLGVLADIEVLDVPGASAGFENDYGAQRDACLESLGGPRLLPAARRGDGRGRSPAERGREGPCARVVGPGDHRPAARRAARVRRRTACCCCRTTRRRSGSARTPRTRCRTCCSTPRSTVARAAVHRDEHRGAGARRGARAHGAFDRLGSPRPASLKRCSAAGR